MSKYHDAYVITQEGQEEICIADGQFLVFGSMQAAAIVVAKLCTGNPERKFTIRPTKLELPWASKK